MKRAIVLFFPRWWDSASLCDQVYRTRRSRYIFIVAAVCFVSGLLFAHSAAATFELTVTKVYFGDTTGEGTVTPSTGSIVWSEGVGSGAYEEGAEVILTAVPEDNSIFSGWSNCPQALDNQCTLTMNASASVGVRFTHKSYFVYIYKQGTGDGTATTALRSITWYENGTAMGTFYHGDVVTFSAVTDPTSEFAGWTNCDSFAGNDCIFAVTGSSSHNLTFNLAPRTLTVTKDGTAAAEGTVTADPGTLVWEGLIGAATYDNGAEVILDAAAGEHSDFTGWSGCGSIVDNRCRVTMDVHRPVTATFTRHTRALTVIRSGNGSGTISADPDTLSWDGAVGAAVYDYGTGVTLTAAAAAGTDFLGWTDCPAVAEDRCLLTMNQDAVVRAEFVLHTQSLTVTLTGSGLGTVTAAPVDLSWSGKIGVGAYDHGTSVTLTPEAGDHSDFTGWINCPQTNGPQCLVPMTAAWDISAVFTRHTRPLTVLVGGAGVGTVAASPGELHWENSIGTANYDYGTEVLLTAAADVNSDFSGWINCPAPEGGECALTMIQGATVTAFFALKQRRLTLTKEGDGAGRVTADQGVLNWSDNSCRVDYDHGTDVTLTAHPQEGSDLAGWVGCDWSSGEQCTVTMTVDHDVAALFSLESRQLTVTVSGLGTGAVTASAGLLTRSGSAWTASYPYNTDLFLTADADDGSIMVGWTGCDAVDGGRCLLNMKTPKQIVARFNRDMPLIALEPRGREFGSVSVSAASPAEIITITNRGGRDLDIYALEAVGLEADMFEISSGGPGPCPSPPFSLGADASCSLTARFAPTKAGVKEVAVVVCSNDHDAASVRVPLSGTGVMKTYPALTLLSPDGGELLLPGTVHTVRWVSPEPADRFKLLYSVDNGLNWIPIRRKITAAEYLWTVPVYAAAKKKCRVKVIAVAGGSRIGAAKSALPFAISPVRLDLPNGGEVFRAGEEYTIAWTTRITVRPAVTAALSLTVDGGYSWTPVAEVDVAGSPSGRHEYRWPAPVLSSPECFMRLTLRDKDGRRVGGDRSDRPFGITP